MLEFVVADMKEVQEHVDASGLKNFPAYLERLMDEWKHIPVNVAITGSSGVGKSTLINTLRGLKPNADGSAAVGVTETTTKPTPYAHPRNKNLRLWDLPGVGTPTFPESTYLIDIGYERFDFFLIISATRFTENDLNLAKSLFEKKKNFAFARSKVDADLKNEAEDYPNKTENEVKTSIRQNIIANLNEHGLKSDFKICLINCKKSSDLEFDLLLIFLVSSLPRYKEEVMLLTLKNLTTEMISKKTTLLRSKINRIALMSAGIGAIPIPGSSLMVDTAILMAATNDYIETLGLDTESLKSLADEYGTSVDHLRKHCSFGAAVGISTVSTVIRSCGTVSLAVALDKVADMAKYAIPFLGSIVSSSVSYVTMSFILNKFLDMVSEDAGNVLHAAIEARAAKSKKDQ